MLARPAHGNVAPTLTSLVVLALVVVPLAIAAHPNPSTSRVSVNSHGVQGNGDSYASGSITTDGRFVAFSALASNLVPGDTNHVQDSLVRDRKTRKTERVSVSTGGAQGNGASFSGVLAANGRFVAFDSEATNLVAGDTNHSRDVFVRDRKTHRTARVSVRTGGAQAAEGGYSPSISANGRFVAFASLSSDLAAGDTNAVYDVFVRDRKTGRTSRVSVASNGAQANADSLGPWISADGRFVSFTSAANNLAAHDTNGHRDAFVRDRKTGQTRRISLSSGGLQGNNDSFGGAVSSGGRFVAFASHATKLVSGDTNGVEDVFVRDRKTQTTQRVSVNSHGTQGNDKTFFDGMSVDGRFVVMESPAGNLASGDTNAKFDVFLRDRKTARTKRVSVGAHGAQGNNDTFDAMISPTGRFVGFDSTATNLVGGDTNNSSDVFVRGPLR